MLDTGLWMLGTGLWVLLNRNNVIDKNENKDKKLYCVATRERFHPKD